MKSWLYCCIIILILLPDNSVNAQDVKESVQAIQDSIILMKKEIINLKEQNKALGARLDSIVSGETVSASVTDGDEDIRKLMEEAALLSEKEEFKEENVAKKFLSGVRQQQGLNPNISLGGDFFGGFSSSGNEFITDPGAISYGNNGFYLREVELGLESALDPFTRGKSFISVTKDAISIEEAYMEWLNLPLNMNLKVGIFYSEFGPLNRYHDHALPQFDRPRALVNLFSNKGLGGTGVATSFMLPKVLFADASTLDLTVVRGTETGDGFSFADKSFLYIGQFKNYYDITQNSYFEFRLSGVTGKNPSEGGHFSYAGSLGLSYKWVPMGREKYRTFDWKTELLYSRRTENLMDITTKGFYSSVQNKLNARFWIGGRIGYSELPFDPDQYEWDYTVNLDFWQSEFVFTRIQYQYNSRNIFLPEHSSSKLPSDHSVVLQINWAMGPHKHEAY
jgi:hypothetical protein